jgi:hypothetical protein
LKMARPGRNLEERQVARQAADLDRVERIRHGSTFPPGLPMDGDDILGRERLNLARRLTKGKFSPYAS